MPFKPQHKMRCYCSKASSEEKVVNDGRGFHTVFNPTTMSRAPACSVEFKEKPKFTPIKRTVAKRDSKSSDIVTCFKRSQATTNSRMTLTAKAPTKTTAENTNAMRKREPNYGVVFVPYRHQQQSQQRQQHQQQWEQQQQQQQPQHFKFTPNPKTGFEETKETTLKFSDMIMNGETNRENQKQKKQAKQQQNQHQHHLQQVPYTEQRLCYERCKSVFPPKTLASPATTNEQNELLEYLENIANSSNNFSHKDLSILLNLQQFRLEHFSDCFNPERQNELKIEQYLEMSKQNQCDDISPPPPPPIWSFDFNRLKSSLRGIVNDDDESLTSCIGATHKRRNDDQQSTLASRSTSFSVSSKLSEDNARKLSRISLNKLRSPLSQSYALVFQGI